MKKVETEKEIVVFIEDNNIAAMSSEKFVNGKASIGMFVVNIISEETVWIGMSIGSENKNIIFYNTKTNKHFKCKLKLTKETGKDNRNRVLKKLNSLEENMIDTPSKVKNKFDKLLLEN